MDLLITDISVPYSLIKGLAAQLTQSGIPNVRLCDCLECHSSTLQEDCVSATGSYPVYGATGLIVHIPEHTRSLSGSL